MVEKIISYIVILPKSVTINHSEIDSVSDKLVSVILIAFCSLGYFF